MLYTLALVSEIGDAIDTNDASWETLTQPAEESAQLLDSVIYSTKNEELKCFNIVNQYRSEAGKTAFVWSERLRCVAKPHSANMLTGQTPFGHDGFSNRIRACGTFTAGAENVAMNYGYSDPITKMCEQWKQSSGHYKNMIGNYKYFGVAFAHNSEGKWYGTQLFFSGTLSGSTSCRDSAENSEINAEVSEPIKTQQPTNYTIIVVILCAAAVIAVTAFFIVKKFAKKPTDHQLFNQA